LDVLALISIIVTAGLEPAAHQKKDFGLRANARTMDGRLKGGHDSLGLSNCHMRLARLVFRQILFGLTNQIICALIAAMDPAVAAILELYPRIYFACHTRHVRDPESGAGLSVHQVSILDHLSMTDPTSLAELAAHMGVTPSTMSLAVDRLEEDGHVRRARDRRDARRLRLLLTAKGKRIREAHSVLDSEKVRAMLTQLSAREKAEAVRGLELLARAAPRAMEANTETAS
jgi:DNA-binding MarR family transcriptional regulator